jgi:PPP family 3-phenylpropionic acid transporter
MKKIWPFTLNALLYAGIASGIPYLVLYYQSVGFDGRQIGLLTGLTPLITLLSIPLWTGLADAKHCHRMIMGVIILAAAITISILPLFTTFLPLLLIIVLYFVFFGPVFSFLDNATMLILGDEKELYGRIRLGGTIGFGLVATVAGVLIQNFGLKLAFWSLGGFLLVAAIASQKLDYRPLKPIGATAGKISLLLRDRRWLLFLLVAFAGGVALSATNSYFFPYLSEMGAGESTMGLMLTIGTLSEIPILFFGNWLIRRFKPAGLLILAMGITGLRLVLFGVSLTIGLALVLQLFNGLTFAAMWMAGVAYADEHAPVGLGATAQGHFGAMVFGFGPAVGGFIGGPLLVSLGGHAIFLIYGVVVLVIVVVAALGQRLLPPEEKITTIT